jgi:peptide deformylase
MLSGLMHLKLPEWSGLGLSAPQIGRDIQLIVINIPGQVKRTIINPELIEQSLDIFYWNEGCLSFPDLFIKKSRPKTIKIKYQNLDGEEIIEEFQDLVAFCIQHEMDHLSGKLLIDNS